MGQSVDSQEEIANSNTSSQPNESATTSNSSASRELSNPTARPNSTSVVELGSSTKVDKKPSVFIQELKKIWRVAGWVYLLMICITASIPAVLNEIFAPGIEIWKVFIITFPLTLAIGIIVTIFICKKDINKKWLLIIGACVCLTTSWAAQRLGINSPMNVAQSEQQVSRCNQDFLSPYSLSESTLARKANQVDEAILVIVKKTGSHDLVTWWESMMTTKEDIARIDQYHSKVDCMPFSLWMYLSPGFWLTRAFLVVLWFLIICLELFGSTYFILSGVVGVFLGWAGSRIIRRLINPYSMI